MNIHFLEFRSRLLKVIYFLIATFLVLFIIRDKLYDFIALPIIKVLPQSSSLIATDITATFFIPTKLSFITAIYLTIPFVFYQVWRFVAPGLYKNEKQTILPLVFLSSFLFYLGNIFAFTIIVPLALSFLTSCTPKNVLIMADIRLYLNFILTISIASGIVFQVPIITRILINFGICSKKNLKQKRPYIIIAAFILGMLLTPPDVVSQILLAIPIWALFELGLIISKEKQI